MLASVTGTLLSSALFAFFAYGAVKVFPFNPGPQHTLWTWEELSRRYARYDILTSLLFLLMSAGMVVLWYLLFTGLAALAHPAAGDFALVVGTDGIYWFMPALFAGLISAIYPTLFVLKRVFVHRYEEYLFYSNWKNGYDVAKSLTSLAGLLAIPVAISVYLGATTYTAFTEERIITKGVLAEAKSYPYDEIAEIRGIACQRSAANAFGTPLCDRYEIEFYDGVVWRSIDGLRNPAPQSDYQLAAMASELSGREITIAR